MRCTRKIILLLVLAGTPATPGCDRPAQSQALDDDGSLAGSTQGANLLLVTLDTTRADRLGCYGWPGAHTPRLDALARSGTRFERAFAHAPITLPSHCTMMTGTRPPENGVRGNFRYRLGPQLPTLAETFRQHDYSTGAFVSAAVLDRRYGLDRGFETYDDDMDGAASSGPDSQRQAEQVADRALAWLDRVKDQPFMCWVHFFDPHPPYIAPQPYVDQTAQPYDAELAYVDANIGRLLDWLEAHSLRDRTLVIVVGDHGESLGEHGYEWHAMLVYQCIMRVPLVFSLPGRLPQAQVDGTPVGLSDIMPTVLELWGWRRPAEVTGTSLLPQLAGQTDHSRAIYGESDYPYYSFGWSKLRCLTDARWKYIRAPRPELYDLEADPNELNSLASVQPDVTARMEQKLSGIEASLRQRPAETVPVDAKTAQALQSLGYVTVPTPAAADTANLKDPADLAWIEHDYRVAEYMLGTDRPDEAIKLLDPLVKRSPESVVLAETLGRAHATAGHLEAARWHLMRAAALDPGSSEVYRNLAKVLANQKRFAQCLEACRRSLAIEPEDQDTRLMLSAAETYLADQESNLAALRAELEADPDSTATRLRLADLLDVLGHSKQQGELLRQGLERQPDSPALAEALARVFAESPDAALRDGPEALRLARRAADASPRPGARCLETLAAAHAEAGQFEEAIRAARQARELYTQAGDARSADDVMFRIGLYEAGLPSHAQTLP